MGTLILVRHGRSTANREHVLAGRTPGVLLDETGLRQAEELVARLDGYPIAAIVSSPLERCRGTVAPLAATRGLAVTIDDRVTEVDYGDWTNRALADLRQEPTWRTVQEQPSAMVFPDGEAMTAVSARAVAAARYYGGAPVAPQPAAPLDAAAVDATDGSAQEHGAVVLCAHGDVIAMILADALGMHLDLFQRLVVTPASVSLVHYTDQRPMVAGINLSGLIPAPAHGPNGAVPEAAPGGVTGDPAPDSLTEQGAVAH